MGYIIGLLIAMTLCFIVGFYTGYCWGYDSGYDDGRFTIIKDEIDRKRNDIKENRHEEGQS